MAAAGFDEIADLAFRRSGQTLRDTQSYLMGARLAPILRRESFSDLSELAACLKARPNPVFEDEIAAALTNKQTRLFDERQTLSRIVTDLVPTAAAEKKAGERVRILSVGGSTGQEAYSLAMLMHEAEFINGVECRADLVSIDICKASTTRARAGIFSHFEIQTGLSVHRMLTHFANNDGSWKASDDLRGRISFRVQNALSDLQGLGDFDIILCRNVLTGMAGPRAGEALGRLARQLRPQGLIFLAEGEALPEGNHGLVPSYAARSGYELAAKSPAAVA